jgi:hypothetical protein
MVQAPHHLLSAGVLEDDNIIFASGHLLESEELAYLQLMGDCEGCPPMVDECFSADFLRSHPPATTSVAADDDVRTDGSEPLDEFGRVCELPEGGLEDDLEEVFPALRHRGSGRR